MTRPFTPAIPRAIGAAAVAAVLATVGGCERASDAPGVDRAVGRACYEQHLAQLPPGTQYEGVEGLRGDELRIRVMPGTGLATVRCRVAADGSMSPLAE